MDFLRESHPERLKDGRFLLACTESALDTYEQTIHNGDTPIEATEQANAVLFFGPPPSTVSITKILSRKCAK